MAHDIPLGLWHYEQNRYTKLKPAWHCGSARLWLLTQKRVRTFSLWAAASNYISLYLLWDSPSKIGEVHGRLQVSMVTLSCQVKFFGLLFNQDGQVWQDKVAVAGCWWKISLLKGQKLFSKTRSLTQHLTFRKGWPPLGTPWLPFA